MMPGRDLVGPLKPVWNEPTPEDNRLAGAFVDSRASGLDSYAQTRMWKRDIARSWADLRADLRASR